MSNEPMMLRIYALPGLDGAIDRNTMLCEDDVLAREPVALVRDLAADSNETFIEVTGNEDVACIWCGREPGDA